jgi:hypothetical protein
MPTHEVIVTIVITSVFLIFGMALVIGSWQSNRPR